MASQEVTGYTTCPHRLTTLAREMGGRLVLLMYSRFSTILLKGASVLRARNRYNWWAFNR